MQPPRDCRAVSPRPQLCGCEAGQAVCVPADWNLIQPMTVYPGHTVCQGTSSPARRKRADSFDSWSDDLLYPEEVYHTQDFQPDHGANITESWPTPKNKTLEKVEAHCRTLIYGSPVSSFCEKQNGRGTSKLLSDCIQDIQVSGG